jgi:hypothetical protein
MARQPEVFVRSLEPGEAQRLVKITRTIKDRVRLRRAGSGRASDRCLQHPVPEKPRPVATPRPPFLRTRSLAHRGWRGRRPDRRGAVRACPDEFTAARNATAKAAKDAGDARGSAAITALRKPTLAAWLANQLVRADPDGIHDLTELGEQLRAVARRPPGDGGALYGARALAGKGKEHLVPRLHP